MGILSEAQIAAYRTEGFTFVPSLLPAAEIAAVMERVRRLCGERRREVILEKDGKAVRSVMNAHRYDDLLGRFVRHPKLIDAARQLVASEVYIFQSIINLKWAFTGDIWPWHQDYPTYMEDDGMPEPRAVNCLVFLEEVTEFNGPLMFIPGSQKAEAHVTSLDTAKTSYPARWTTSDLVEAQARSHGIAAPKGPPGSVVFAHTNILHGSGPNMSPWGRAMMSLTLNSLENRHHNSRRPDWVVLNDYTPVVPLGAGESLVTE
jgi:ectoine hydroxylase